MGSRQNGLLGGGSGTLLSGAWGIYSTFTTVRDLPEDAGWVAKMMADPPNYAPWLLFGAFVIFLAWTFWKRDSLGKPDYHVASVKSDFAFINSKVDNRGGNITVNRIDSKPVQPRICPLDCFAGLRAHADCLVLLRYISSDPEAFEFVQSIVQALNHAGIAARISGEYGSLNLWGARAIPADNEAGKTAAQSISTKLRQHGFECTVGSDRSGDDPYVILEVGRNR